MSVTIGFALLTHSAPEQVAYLCRRLSTMFGDPPIAIHHDYGKCPLDSATLPGRVAIVSDWEPTGWGKSSLVTAYLKTLRLLHETASPDWTVFLSGADYPVRAADRVMEDLKNTTADAWLDFREISEGCTQPSDAYSIAAAGNFKTDRFLKSARERYLGFDLLPFRIRKHIGLRNHTLYARHPLLTRAFTPFSSSFRPFAGDQWHTINRRAAEVLLENDQHAQTLRSFYRRRAIVDESYYHTILLNRPELKVQNDNRRFAIWIDDTPSPQLVTREDIPAMVSSGAHFARKFAYDPSLYAEVDRAVANS